MKPLTHRQRAEKVLRMMKLNPFGARITMVAEETYPTELLEAAKKLLRIVKSEAAHLERRYGQEFAALEIAEAEAALALYEETRASQPSAREES